MGVLNHSFISPHQSLFRPDNCPPPWAKKTQDSSINLFEVEVEAAPPLSWTVRYPVGGVYTWFEKRFSLFETSRRPPPFPPSSVPGQAPAYHAASEGHTDTLLALLPRGPLHKVSGHVLSVNTVYIYAMGVCPTFSVLFLPSMQMPSWKVVRVLFDLICRSQFPGGRDSGLKYSHIFFERRGPYMFAV